MNEIKNSHVDEMCVYISECVACFTLYINYNNVPCFVQFTMPENVRIYRYNLYWQTVNPSELELLYILFSGDALFVLMVSITFEIAYLSTHPHNLSLHWSHFNLL